MADATEIRGDSITPSIETAAKTETLTKAKASVKAKAAAKIEAPAAPATAPAAPAARTSVAAAWMGKVRTGIAAAVPANRAALLAAGIGFVAGAGLLAGTIGAMGVGHLFAAPTPGPAPWSAAAEETRALKQTVAKLEAQFAGLKANVETANRQSITQRSQIMDRYERSARTQTEMQTRLVKIGAALDRLEKRVVAAAAAETTGSVAPAHAAAAAATPKAPPAPPVATGWVIRDVFRGRALVASRRGVFEAAPGLFLPELGRVEAVTRKNGRWMVVAEKGVIMTARRPRTTHTYDAD